MRVVLVAAVTADGFIARHTRHAADWTSKADKRQFVELTKEIGTIVLGSTTFETIGRALPGRRMIVMTSRPEAYTVEGVEFVPGSAMSIVDQLSSEGLDSLAVIGGAHVYGQFLAAGLVDEVVLTVEPVLFGQGVTLSDVACDLNLTLTEVNRLGEDSVVMRYNVEH